MKTIRVKYLRRVIIARRWANTEKGEKTIVTIGAIWMVLAFVSFGLLIAGMLEPKMGMERAIMFVVAVYVIIWALYQMIVKPED